jgi:hypothetical protein
MARVRGMAMERARDMSLVGRAGEVVMRRARARAMRTPGKGVGAGVAGKGAVERAAKEKAAKEKMARARARGAAAAAAAAAAAGGTGGNGWTGVN